nr:tyrosine-type recombinase/integrase [Acidobacteriota bacterium]
CVKLLRKQLVRQAMDKLGAGGAYRENDFVFATGVGTPMDINNLGKQSFLPILKAAGISHRRLYDLRHTAITLMLKANVPLVVVSERAGHASVKMTLDVYAHVLPGQQDESTNTMSALFDRLATQQLAGSGA